MTENINHVAVIQDMNGMKQMEPVNKTARRNTNILVSEQDIHQEMARLVKVNINLVGAAQDLRGTERAVFMSVMPEVN